MPYDLVETITKKGEKMINKLVTEEEGKGKPQLIPVFEFILNIIENNNLIPAWAEIPDIKDILHLEKNSPDI